MSASVLAADPSRLRTAAARLGTVSSQLSQQARQVAHASKHPQGWTGEAAGMFQMHCARLAGDVNTGSAALGRAARVVATLAAELERAQEMARDAQVLGSSAVSLRAQTVSMESSPATRMMLEEAHAMQSRAVSLAIEAEQFASAAGARAAQELEGIAAATPSQQDRGWAGVLGLNRHDLAAYLNTHLTGLPMAVREMSVQQRVLLRAPKPEEYDQADEGCNDFLTCALQTGQIMTAPIADAITSGATRETRELLGQDYVDENTGAYRFVHATTNVVSIVIPGPKLLRGAKYLDETLRLGDNVVASAAKGTDEVVDLTTAARRKHILDGEVLPNGRYNGGHRAGTGFPRKSEFPKSWSDDDIIHWISDVARDPRSTSRLGDGGDIFVKGTRRGVDIEVLIRKGEIWTGYPTNRPRNP